MPFAVWKDDYTHFEHKYVDNGKLKAVNFKDLDFVFKKQLNFYILVMPLQLLLLKEGIS